MTNGVRDPLTAARFDAAMDGVRRLDAKIRDFERRHPRYAAKAFRIRVRRLGREAIVRFVLNGEVTVVISAEHFSISSYGAQR